MDSLFDLTSFFTSLNTNEKIVVEIGVAAAVVTLVYKCYQRPANFPPGPRGLPLVGYVPFIGNHDPKYPYKAMMKLSSVYNSSVVGFYLGPSQPFISICGYEAVKEALHHDDFNGRPPFKTRMITDGTVRSGLGIMFSEGDLWQEHRRFTLRHLRDMGFGKSSIENQMMDEIQELIQEIKSSIGSNPNNVVDFKGMFNLSTLNVLWAMITGSRRRRDDTQFKALLNTIDEAFRAGNSVRNQLDLPEFLYKLFPVLRKYFGVRHDLIAIIQKFALEIIEEHEKRRNASDYDGNEAPDNFIDAFLDEMERQKTNSSSTFTKEQLICIILFDLFSAGADTTSNSVGFVLLYLISHPEVQKKMQAELDDVCGENLPSLDDKSRLVYTEAVLIETQRMASIAPSTVPHVALKDTLFRGHFIPKGSIVSPNLYSVHMDPTYWTNPEVFQPERHLNSDGQLIRTDHFIAFGTGKRMCMGESLAKQTFYLFTAALVKTFQFKALPNQPPPTLAPRVGFTLAYEGFKAVVIPRI